MSAARRRPGPACAILLVVGLLVPTSASAMMQQLIDAFARSDFDVGTRDTQVPLPAVSWLLYGYYGEQRFDEVAGDGDASRRFAQHEISQAFGLPIPVGRRHVFVVGDYVQWVRFRFHEPTRESEDVFTVGVPLGWATQATERWQLAAFAMPFGHSALGGGGPWELEVMGGAFGRYRFERGALILGAVIDQGFDELYIYPYLGGSWDPTPEWTVSLVLPWPAVLYAPVDGWLLRLGVSPSGGRWNLEGEDELDVAFGGWSFGGSLSARVGGPFWLSAHVGFTGLNSLRVSDSGDTRFETDVDLQPFVRVGVELRP